jgi:hypothetical protein
MASLLRRIRTKADALAAGTDEPAGLEPDEPLVRRPTARERGRMRRRLRKLVRIRDAKLRELGGLVLEMQRLGRENAALLKERAAELQAIDDEARALAGALGEEKDLEEVLAAGITGACAECGALMSTDDRFCSRCGTPSGQARTPDPPEAPETTGNGNHAPVTEELQHS